MSSRIFRLLSMLMLASLVALLALAVNGLAAVPVQGSPFDEAELFFELNDTDGDLGLHAEIDGDEWTTLEIRRGAHQLLDISTKGDLRDQGLTQLHFESTEPQFMELDPAEFFERFPEGEYVIAGRAHRGDAYESAVVLSHVLAAPPVARVSGLVAAPSCDTPALPEVPAPVVIDWDPVSTSHPTIGLPGPVTITRYQFFVEQGDVKLAVDLPPSVTGFVIPASITEAGGVFKFEIIARTSTGNNTAVESCFRMQ